MNSPKVPGLNLGTHGSIAAVIFTGTVTNPLNAQLPAKKTV